MFSLAHVLVVNPESSIRSVSDLIQQAKAQPGKLTFASQGVGSGGHLLGEMLKFRNGIDVTHVPYRGTSHAFLISWAAASLFSLTVCQGAVHWWLMESWGTGGNGQRPRRR